MLPASSQGHDTVARPAAHASAIREDDSSLQAARARAQRRHSNTTLPPALAEILAHEHTRRGGAAVLDARVEKARPTVDTIIPLASIAAWEASSESSLRCFSEDKTRLNYTRDALHHTSLNGGLCVVHAWWSLIRFHFPDPKSIVDVGANKGLVSVLLLQLWRPELGISHTAYFPQLEKYFSANNATSNPGGPCGTGEPDPIYRGAFPPTSTAIPAASVHSVEPSVLLNDMAVSIRDRFLSPADRHAWQWHLLALQESESVVAFEAKWGENSMVIRDGRGKGIGGVGVMKEVRGTTLEAFAREQRLPSLGVLKVDAEGSDAQVISGAARLFAQRKVSVLVVETPLEFPMRMVDQDGRDVRVNNFRSLMDYFEEVAGMDCFMPLKGPRRLMATKCWHPTLWDDHMRAMKGPRGNVMCVNRDSLPELVADFRGRADQLTTSPPL